MSADKPALSIESTRRPRRKQYREVPEVAACTRRLTIAVGRRIADGDPEDLVELVRIDQAVAEAMQLAVDGLRSQGRSDTEIGRVLGITKQAVAQRYPRGDSS